MFTPCCLSDLFLCFDYRSSKRQLHRWRKQSYPLHRFLSIIPNKLNPKPPALTDPSCPLFTHLRQYPLIRNKSIKNLFSFFYNPDLIKLVPRALFHRTTRQGHHHLYRLPSPAKRTDTKSPALTSSRSFTPRLLLVSHKPNKKPGLLCNQPRITPPLNRTWFPLCLPHNERLRFFWNRLSNRQRLHLALIPSVSLLMLELALIASKKCAARKTRKMRIETTFLLIN